MAGLKDAFFSFKAAMGKGLTVGQENTVYLYSENSLKLPKGQIASSIIILLLTKKITERNSLL